MEPDRISEALTFDDVLLAPQRSDVLPADVDVTTRLTRTIALKIPIVSAAMDTVSEAHLAIALAQEGGLGVIHKNMSIASQAAEVDKVKRSESGMIVDPVTVAPDAPVAEALDLMAKYRISGVPVTVGPRLVGILTNRDLRFETRTHLPVSDLMTKDELVTVPVGTTLEQAREILHTHKIEKLLVVDADFNLKGLITVKDIQKQIKYPNACKDELGRLRVGAAVGVTEDVVDRVRALVEAKVDVVAVDTAHGHTRGVQDTVGQLKTTFPDLELIAGNVGTYEGTRDLIAAGVSAVKVGMGPGSICTTRVVSGAGMPQITAISEAARAAAETDTPLIADGGIKFSGDVTKGDRRGSRFGHDRLALRRHRRKPRRADSPPGALLQIVPGHGLTRRHEVRVSGPLLPGGRRLTRQARPGRHRGDGSVQGPNLGHGPAAGGWPESGHGLQRSGQHSRPPEALPLRAHHLRRSQGEPRPRRHHHQGGSELPS